MQTYLLDSGARHTALLLSHLCKVADLLLLATGRLRQRFFAGVGGARVKCVGRLILKVHRQASKKISNGCRDVQHTGLQSTQTRRTTGKQGAQTRGSSAHLPKHPYISGCMIIVVC